MKRLNNILLHAPVAATSYQIGDHVQVRWEDNNIHLPHHLMNTEQFLKLSSESQQELKQYYRDNIETCLYHFAELVVANVNENGHIFCVPLVSDHWFDDSHEVKYRVTVPFGCAELKLIKKGTSTKKLPNIFNRRDPVKIKNDYEHISTPALNDLQIGDGIDVNDDYFVESILTRRYNHVRIENTRTGKRHDVSGYWLLHAE